MTPTETRAGLGPAVTPADVERVVLILARRAVRADRLAARERVPDRAAAATVRHETYLQAIAELLGVTVAEVRAAYRARSAPFDSNGATRVQPSPPAPRDPRARRRRAART